MVWEPKRGFLDLLRRGRLINLVPGYKVYQVTPKTEAQAELLHQLHGDPNFDFFKDTRFIGEPSDVMVSPKVQWYFEEAMKNLASDGLKYKVLVEDVQKRLDHDEEEMQKVRVSRSASSTLFDRYLSHDEVLDYLNTLAIQYPSIVSLESIGKSYEGRDLLLIHIGQELDNSSKPTIFIDAGIHARDWATTPTALYVINQLVENPNNTDLIKNVNWAIIPALNPDGYEFSRSSTENRIWRKNRTPNNDSDCIGTDLNRNFAFHWMEIGASSSPCTVIYAGPEAFSEPETAAIENYFLQNGTNVALYVTIHSFGNFLLYPWGYTSELPNDVDTLQVLGQEAAEAIERVSTLGSRYTIGSTTNVLYAAAGGSDDWVKGVAGVPLAYSLELPAGGSYGFNPPETMIMPIVQETFEAFRVFGSYVDSHFG